MLALTGLPSWAEIVIVLFVGLLLFGRRLPEVGRSLGRTIVEFKKGIRDVERDVDQASRSPDVSNRIGPPKDGPTSTSSTSSTASDDAAEKTTNP